MNNSFVVIAYSIYLPVSILLTLYVAHTLFKNGKIFMLEIFNGRTEIAFATNRLFEVGFYLLNIGYAMLTLKFANYIETKQGMIENLSIKLGGFSIYLGIMLFLNLYLFFRGKRKSREHRQATTEVKL